MDETQIKVFKKKLEELLVKTSEEIQYLKEQTKPIAPSDSIGRLSRMEAIGEKSVNEAALRQAELKLKRIENALKIIETDPDEYGICSLCEEEISENRLKAMPEAPFCLDCAESRDG